MGRYPLLEASNAYLEFVRPFVADLTHRERGRKLRMLAKALQHSSTATAEQFYARIRTRRARDDLERVWETPARVNSP